MARSGSYDFTLNESGIIHQALRGANVIGDAETAPSDTYQYCHNALNMLIKQWQAEGMPLWNRRIGYLFPAYQTSSYLLGSSGTNATNSYISTQLNGVASASATSLTVDSTTGMTVGDYIGIELSDNTRQWTTIATIPTSTSLTINTGLTTSASDDAYLVAYTSNINRPLRIFNSNLLDITNDIETQLKQISFDQYFKLSDKTVDGQPSSFYYDELMDNGVLYIWPRPIDVNTIIKFIYHDANEDFDLSTNAPDFPNEWLNALVKALQVEIVTRYGRLQELQIYQMQADKAKMLLDWYNTDEADLFIRTPM